jgi:hypothetical protein
MMRKEQPWLLVTSPSKLLVFLVFVLQPKECSPDLACSQPLQALKIGGGVGIIILLSDMIFGMMLNCRSEAVKFSTTDFLLCLFPTALLFNLLNFAQTAKLQSLRRSQVVA